MFVVSKDLVEDKRVLLRLDLDVPIEEGGIVDDFRLRTAIPTIELCLHSAKSTILMGHIGRPGGVEDPKFSVAPIYEWLNKHFGKVVLENGKLRLLENLRFEKGEDECSLDYAKQLASLGEFFVNEAFAAHHKAASTTILPTLLPHAAGLRFAQEVKKLSSVRENPERPQVAIIGGAKIEDKYRGVIAFSKLSDKVLVGGLLPEQIKQKDLYTAPNVMLAESASSGIDISPESVTKFKDVIKDAKQIIWAGPMGKYEDPLGNKADEALAQAVINSGAESIIGGGDTEAALEKFLTHFNFVSVGGGAMLEFLTEGTLPTVEALK